MLHLYRSVFFPGPHSARNLDRAPVRCNLPVSPYAVTFIDKNTQSSPPESRLLIPVFRPRSMQTNAAGLRRNAPFRLAGDGGARIGGRSVGLIRARWCVHQDAYRSPA